MALDEKILDEQIAGYKKPEDLIGENGLLKELTKRLLERAMKEHRQKMDHAHQRLESSSELLRHFVRK